MVRMKKIDVGLLRETSYTQERISQRVEELFAAVGFQPSRGDVVLLKPNLVAPAVVHDLSSTHPEFVAGVAAWFLDNGCRVRVGDSPASGSCQHAMTIVGLDKVVQKLGLETASFAQTVTTRLNCGVNVEICRDALDCDLLVNLPKVKSHALVRVTLASKNYFGIVKGWRKAVAHQVHGGGDASSFIDILCDLPQVIQKSISLCDGITAMHITGPMGGEPYPLNLMGCSLSPQPLDASLLAVLGVEPELSPLWCRFDQRRVPGNNLGDLNFPLLSPDELAVHNFIVPDQLNPVRFNLTHVAGSVLKRLRLRLGF